MNQKLKSISLMRNGINNMFNSRHYVPILKWKRAEQGALKEVQDEVKDNIIPLIELVMPKPKFLYKNEKKKIKKTREEIFQELILDFETKRIVEIPQEIMKSWGKRPAFIDFSLLYTTELKSNSIKKILEKAEELGIYLTPVFNLADDEKIVKEIKQLFKKYKKGICLRIISSDLENICNLNKKLEEILRRLEARKSDIDLLVDIKEIKENDSKYLKYLNLSQEIIDLNEWRSFIFASGVFPETLSDCKLDEPNFIPRSDWQNWKKQLESRTLKRNPTFADYAIRHPIYNEAFLFYHPTTSIKYTLKDEWLILKGQKQKHEQYLANAKLLLEELSDKFCGENFSYGDRYIVEKARHYDAYIKDQKKIKGTGSTETWLRAGINHHLVLVAHQVANLP